MIINRNVYVKISDGHFSPCPSSGHLSLFCPLPSKTSRASAGATGGKEGRRGLRAQLSPERAAGPLAGPFVYKWGQ